MFGMKTLVKIFVMYSWWSFWMEISKNSRSTSICNIKCTSFWYFSFSKCAWFYSWRNVRFLCFIDREDWLSDPKKVVRINEDVWLLNEKSWQDCNFDPANSGGKLLATLKELRTKDGYEYRIMPQDAGKTLYVTVFCANL